MTPYFIFLILDIYYNSINFFMIPYSQKKVYIYPSSFHTAVPHFLSSPNLILTMYIMILTHFCLKMHLNKNIIRK